MKLTLSQKRLAQITGHNFTKELKDFEYETKFDIKNDRLSSLGILKMIRSCFKDNQRFILCKIKNGDKLLTRVSFFVDGNTEYSLFKYCGAKMVKVKKHKIIKGMLFSIFKNSENLLIDKNDFSKRLRDLKPRFKRHNFSLINLNSFLKQRLSLTNIGEMIKNRVKDFVVDIYDGRIYAVAVTFCKSKNKVQKQLEIEYAGYLPSLKNSRRNIERQIIMGVQELSQYIYKNFLRILKPSIERKFEFVKKVNPQFHE